MAGAMDSTGAAISCSRVCISIGNNDIMNNVEWNIMPGDRWGLVGENGAGKSTLFRAITGNNEVKVREGNIQISKKLQLGYLEQKGVSGSTRSVWDEVMSQMTRVQTATRALEEKETQVAEGDCSEETLSALNDAVTEFEAAGGYTVGQKVEGVLKGLGFAESGFKKGCDEFSGGWQMRIALGRLLLSEPDLLLLDEPTNHLDLSARTWLAQFLAKYEGTLLVVSHDEPLLKTACSSIAECRAGRVELYKSRSFTQWQSEREERVKVQQATWESTQREIARLQSYVDRFGAKTMGAVKGQEYLRQIEKLERSTAAPPEALSGVAPRPPIRFATPPRGSQELLSLRGADIAWTSAEGGVEVVVEDVNVVVERGMRVVVRGPNGAGKSTVLGALSGALPLAAGVRVEGEGLAVGTFTQDLAQDLDGTKSGVEIVTDEVRRFDPTCSDEKARSVLGALGLMQEKSVRKVGVLSGGEKARVALAKFVMIPSNLLLLDEPSNHLDVGTLDRLTTALRQFEGAFIVVSHDRPFLEALEPTHVLTVRDGYARLEERSLTESDWQDEFGYRQTLHGTTLPAPSVSPVSLASPPSVTAARAADPALSKEEEEEEKKKKKKEKNNATRRLSKIETALSKAEAKMATLEDAMLVHGGDREQLRALQKEKEEVESKVSALYEEMETLMEVV